MNHLWTKIKILLELVVFKHSIFALPFLLCSMMIASKMLHNSIWFGFKILILGLICAISARNFAMAMNRFLDEDIDKDNPRCKDRPNINGCLSKKAVMIFSIVNALIFLASSFCINSLAFVLAFPILFILAFYSLFKRFSSLAHLVLGFCLALAPIAGSVIVLGKIELYSVILALGVMFWTAGFDLLYSLQDMNYDKAKGLYSIPALYGADVSLFFSALCHFMAVLFWLLFVWEAELGFIAFLGVLISAVFLFFEQKIVRLDFLHINKAFFTLNGYLSIVFFLFIWIDLLW